MDELTQKTEEYNFRYYATHPESYYGKHRINCDCRHCRQAWKLAEQLGRGFDVGRLIQAQGERDELETEGGIMGEILDDEQMRPEP